MPNPLRAYYLASVTVFYTPTGVDEQKSHLTNVLLECTPGRLINKPDLTNVYNRAAERALTELQISADEIGRTVLNSLSLLGVGTQGEFTDRAPNVPQFLS